jgi:hypothetical protein
VTTQLERRLIETKIAHPFHIQAIPPAIVERILARGVDDHGNSVSIVVDEGGSPCRHCLRDASPGERLALFAYRPFESSGAYAEVGPIFVHADGCAPYAEPNRYPQGFAHRRLLFRAYNGDGAIEDALLQGERDPQAVIAELFSNPLVRFVHARNVAYGCYMFRIDRAG